MRHDYSGGYVEGTSNYTLVTLRSVEASPTSQLWFFCPSTPTVLPPAHPRVGLLHTAELTILYLILYFERDCVYHF